MAIESINGVNLYTVTANDVKCKSSYEAEKSHSWSEGEKRETISETEKEFRGI